MEMRIHVDLQPGTYLRTSSRLRFEALILRAGTAAASSLKLGEYRLSSLTPPMVVACITPANRMGPASDKFQKIHCSFENLLYSI